PADIRKAGGVARMASIKVIKEIMDVVSIPVMAKCRIGHIAEARILESVGIDFIDESEVLTPADDRFHVNKHEFKVPFVCGCRNLGEALRRIAEGAAMIRTKGEAGTGNVVEAVKHARQVWEEVRKLKNMPEEELVTVSKETGAPLDLIRTVKELGRLPVVNFAAGGVATPADADLMMILGMDGVFVGSGIFKSENPGKMASAIVQAVLHWNDFDMLAKISEDLPPAMKGIEISELEVHLQERGW
ncbi:MAG TPA: pyridoxal 5'-phosphate synthase lyase subunit PdxS, partial [Thermotogota bacterium]|nr:pyridoxal 5'-phosphate synthase lyase subunit PdxS [Thermotogota bacterium]